ncbi:MAG: carbohydrate ABC transporter permease [Candidatus Izimaplasma sp.]|nr:carbohydrate ABC transporter permease [Candidatus Izimaplasma bacterium]
MKKLKRKRGGIFNFSDYKSLKARILYLLVIILLVIIFIISIFPPLWLLLSSFKETDQVLTKNFSLFPKSIELIRIVEVWNQFDFGRYYLNSFLLVAGAVISSILFNGLLAYGVAVIKPKGSHVIDLLVMSTLMIPAIINISPLYMNIVNLFNSLGDIFNTNVWNIPYFTYLPLWLIYGANAYYYILFRIYFAKIPKTIFDAAKIDGANNWQIFRYILVPLSIPIISVVGIFTIIAAWSDFLLPSLMTQINQSEQPIMVKLYNMFVNQTAQVTFQERLMTIMFSIIPPIILFVIFQKRIAENVATTGLKE